jgi:RNA polymerase sigma-70 factor (ECF subfamily)
MGDNDRDLDEPAIEAATGAEWALGALYRTLHAPLVGFLGGLAPGEAEDLAAETWIDAARRLPDFEGDGAEFRRLLFTLARRRAIDHGRKRLRRRTEPMDFAELTLFAPGPDVEESVTERDSSRQAIARIFALLPRPQAEVVVLGVVARLSVSEVAEIVGRTPAAVSVLQNRGLRRLAAKIGSRSGWGRGAQTRDELDRPAGTSSGGIPAEHARSGTPGAMAWMRCARSGSTPRPPTA